MELQYIIAHVAASSGSYRLIFSSLGHKYYRTSFHRVSIEASTFILTLRNGFPMKTKVLPRKKIMENWFLKFLRVDVIFAITLVWCRGRNLIQRLAWEDILMRLKFVFLVRIRVLDNFCDPNLQRIIKVHAHWLPKCASARSSRYIYIDSFRQVIDTVYL